MLTTPQLARQAEPPVAPQSSNNSPIWLGEARGLAHLHLSVSWVDSMGGGLPHLSLPISSADRCKQARDSLVHPIHAHQHIWWTQAGRRVPRVPEQRGQAHFYPGWGLGCMYSHSLSWRVGAVMGSQLFQCLTGSHCSPTLIQSCLWQTVDPVWVILDGNLDRHVKACEEQRAEKAKS